MIRVLLVDDQRLMRDGMKTLLSLEPDLEVAGEAGNGAEGLRAAVALRPDVVLMDIRMPGMNGVEATREIRRALPATRVLVLTTFDDDDLVMDALLEGAAGYLTKDLPAEEIAEAIRKVQTGGVVMPPPIAAKVVAELARRSPPAAAGKEDKALLEHVTEREREVLRLLGQGYSNKEIAEALYITEGTAKNHVSSVIEKLGLRDRTQAALWAVRRGLL
ncbi:MAG TPA: response regulator transcription factor [Symbiobacteriaceae bacterium]|nr:response regulator transcription factor [Symbiobacteriaceae bacterium]